MLVLYACIMVFQSWEWVSKNNHVGLSILVNNLLTPQSLQEMIMKVKVPLCNPMDYTVYGIL